jgi:hypothetical protein
LNSCKELTDPITYLLFEDIPMTFFLLFLIPYLLLAHSLIGVLYKFFIEVLGENFD